MNKEEAEQMLKEKGFEIIDEETWSNDGEKGKIGINIENKTYVYARFPKPKPKLPKFEVEFLELDYMVKGAIKECEGKHIQQIAYSSYHDALTQICFGCNKIRTSLMFDELQEQDRK